MKHSRNNTFATVSIIILSISIFACSQFDNIPGSAVLLGNWDAVGTDENGAAYKSDLVVTSRSTDGVHHSYKFNWENGSQKYTGTGVYLGTHLGISYVKDGDGRSCSAMFYQSFAADEIQAKVAVWNSENWGSE